MNILTLFIGMLVITLPVHARLGDTEAKVIERYGKPIKIYRDVMGRMGHIHSFDGYNIVVQYVGGISQSEVYARPNDAEISEAELNAIHAANAMGRKWEKYPNPVLASDGTPMRAWVILEIRALSVYGPSGIDDKEFKHAVSVGTRAYVEQTKALTKERNKR